GAGRSGRPVPGEVGASAALPLGHASLPRRVGAIDFGIRLTSAFQAGKGSVGMNTTTTYSPGTSDSSVPATRRAWHRMDFAPRRGAGQAGARRGGGRRRVQSWRGDAADGRRVREVRVRRFRRARTLD